MHTSQKGILTFFLLVACLTSVSCAPSEKYPAWPPFSNMLGIEKAHGKVVPDPELKKETGGAREIYGVTERTPLGLPFAYHFRVYASRTVLDIFFPSQVDPEVFFQDGLLNDVIRAPGLSEEETARVVKPHSEKRTLDSATSESEMDSLPSEYASQACGGVPFNGTPVVVRFTWGDPPMQTDSTSVTPGTVASNPAASEFLQEPSIGTSEK